MMSVLISLLATVRGLVRSRAALHAEVLALRHQLLVASAVATATATARERRPLALGVAVAFVARLARGARDCQARDGHRLAPPKLPLVLDMEEPPTPRPADCPG